MKAILVISVTLLASFAPGQDAAGPYARVARAAKLMEQGQLAGCRAQLLTALKAIPNYAQAWYLLGLTQARQGQRTTAITSFSRCVRLDTRHVGARLALADALLGRDRMASAKHAQAALDHAKRSSQLVQATRLLAQAGAGKAAAAGLARLEKARRLPRIEVLRLRAEIHVALRELGQAARCYEALHKLRPQDQITLESLARLAERRRDIAVARSWLSRLLRLRPRDIALRERYVRLLERNRSNETEIERQRELIKRLRSQESPTRPQAKPGR